MEDWLEGQFNAVFTAEEDCGGDTEENTDGDTEENTYGDTEEQGMLRV